MPLDIVPFDPLNPADDELFVGWMAVQEATARAAYGDRLTAWSTDEIRAFYVDQKDERRSAWAGVVDRTVVAHLELQLPISDNTHLAAVEILVDPESRRRGIGSALLEVAERAARDEGRAVIGAESDVATDRDDPAAGFAARHGYTAEQTELRSDLELPLGDGVLAAATAEAQKHASGYEVLTSWDGVPDEWLADRAELSRRMSIDVPLGGLAITEEKWDGERVRRSYALARAQGRRVVESVARHTATGRLVGYTTMAVASHTPDLAYQWDTLVLHEHRGRRLGLLLKAANLRALTAGLPGVRRVATWNARENEPMLRVNRALGFEVVGRLTEWQRKLD
jgi:GNAT superfamily N-acetyltransferase